MLFLYRLIINILYPFIFLIIYIRMLIGKEDKKRFKEKLYPSYFGGKKSVNKKLIWFHAASIGEFLSIISLLKKIDKKKKKTNFLVTTSTKSSGELFKKELEKYSNVTHRYFPIDHPILVDKFLNEWNPKIAIVVDTEIWPNFITEINKRKIPLILINGRITKKTFKKWKFFPQFSKKIFGCFDLCLAANKDSKKNLLNLNANNVKFLGNLKFTSKIKEVKLDKKNKFIIKNKNLWCAASTHFGEDSIILKTHIMLQKNNKNVLTIIVPRHINRVKEIKSMAKNMSLKTQILNENDIINKNVDIIIINSFGVLLKIFTYCKLIFMGKSLLEKKKLVGGQNPIEAAKLGCKIYHGPYVYNFREIYELLKSKSISFEIQNEKELAKNLNVDFKIKKRINVKIVKKINRYGEKILINTLIPLNKFL